MLQRAIESYREKHQGPVLRRASELFSSLTLGDHLGLTTGFGDDDKPVLVAVRKTKGQVHVEGLSDGTRDQLYLALRLAAIEHHVKVVSPSPVILDDILITVTMHGRRRCALANTRRQSAVLAMVRKPCAKGHPTYPSRISVPGTLCDLQVETDAFSVDEHAASIQQLLPCAVVFLVAAHGSEREIELYRLGNC